MSATLLREDGLTDLIHWSFGRVLLERSAREMIRLGHLQPTCVEIVPTGWQWNKMTASRDKGQEGATHNRKRLTIVIEKDLVEDAGRNALIADRIAAEAKKGETCLVLVKTRDHARELAKMIVERGIEAMPLTGQTAKKKRKAIIENIRNGQLLVAVATSLADEGLDLPRLSVLGLASPQRARGVTLQRLGRLLRLWPGKRPKLIDWVDSVPTLASRASSRHRVYREAGLL